VKRTPWVVLLFDVRVLLSLQNAFPAYITTLREHSQARLYPVPQLMLGDRQLRCRPTRRTRPGLLSPHANS
jgi:hypothetical protein